MQISGELLQGRLVLVDLPLPGTQLPEEKVGKLGTCWGGLWHVCARPACMAPPHHQKNKIPASSRVCVQGTSLQLP